MMQDWQQKKNGEKYKGGKMNFEERVKKVRKDMYDIINSVTEYEGDGLYTINDKELLGACKHFAYQKCSQTEEFDKFEEEYQQMLQACKENVSKNDDVVITMSFDDFNEFARRHKK